MPISPTRFAVRTRQSTNWNDAKSRVLRTYREWMRAAPEIQVMYSLPVSVAHIRTRIRQEFERHRFVDKLPVIDVLLFRSHADYQETMNYWKQIGHLMGYFKEENFRSAERLPSSFMHGFLEGRN